MQTESKARPDRDPVSTQAARWWGLSMDAAQLSIALRMNVGFGEDKEDDPISGVAIVVRKMLRQAAIAVDAFRSRG
jgi:hypothetical protein